jgi:hypothetical protein
MVSAMMKPFSKSVWITPAACGARVPTCIPHDRTCHTQGHVHTRTHARTHAHTHNTYTQRTRAHTHTHAPREAAACGGQSGTSHAARDTRHAAHLPHVTCGTPTTPYTHHTACATGRACHRTRTPQVARDVRGARQWCAVTCAVHVSTHAYRVRASWRDRARALRLSS